MRKIIELLCKGLVKYCEARGKVFYIKGGPQNTTIYLARYIVFKSKYGCIYIHRFMRSDSDTPHDHPWNFFTYVISGRYQEVFYERKAKLGYIDNDTSKDLEFRAFWQQKTNTRLAGSIAYRNATDVHQVVVDKARDIDEVEDAPFTVCLIGPRIREWGFWSDNGSTFTDWRKYLSIKPNDPRIEGSE